MEVHTILTFREIWAEFSPDELEDIAQIKRFLERWGGDKRFRKRLETSDDLPGLAREYGLQVDLEELRPLYDTGLPPGVRSLEEPLPGLGQEGGQTEDEDEAPRVRLWKRYRDQLFRFRDEAHFLGDCPDHHPRFHAWRKRQTERLRSECGPHADGIVHPVVAFELADGCSVGCWFCGISADKFNGHWPYTPENAELWTGVLEALSEELGPALRSGFLYWATDPLDNPDYPRFLEDFYGITGQLPQTTTAIPLRDVELTKEVLRLFDQLGYVANRFSLLNTKMLDRVHDTFAPQELLGVELVLQMKDSVLTKSPAGRARKRRLKRGEPSTGDPVAEASTIACVTGFLVNMPKRTIRLVSPCSPTDRWPDGYKTWDTRTFEDVASFQQAVRGLIEDHVQIRPRSNQPIRFRADLEFEVTATGFTLSTPMRSHDIQGPPFTTDLGRSIEQGGETHASLRKKILGAGGSPFALEILLGRLYELGLLAEDLDMAADFPPQEKLVTLGAMAPSTGPKASSESPASLSARP